MQEDSQVSPGYLRIYCMFQFIKRLFGYDDSHEPLSLVPRSGRWRSVRAAHLEKQPVCQVCGGDKMLNVHHIIPFHLDMSKECEPENLITLCEGSHHINCHLLFGHLGDWHCTNTDVVHDAETWREKLSNRK